MPAPAPQVEIPEAELRWRFSRSSGPGGQHVNTTDSRVSLSWDLEASAVLDETQRARARRRLAGDLVDGVLTVHASEHRSQARNRDVARDRLAAIVRAAVAPPPPRRRPDPPDEGVPGPAGRDEEAAGGDEAAAPAARGLRG